MIFKVCARCGTRNGVRPGTPNVSPDYCVRCDPAPKVTGFNVQVHGLSHNDGEPPVHYRLRVVDSRGEVVFSQEPMGRDEARALALTISESLVKFMEMVGC